MRCFCLFLKAHPFYISNCFTSFKLYNEIPTVADSGICIEIDLFDYALNGGADDDDSAFLCGAKPQRREQLRVGKNGRWLRRGQGVGGLVIAPLRGGGSGPKPRLHRGITWHFKQHQCPGLASRDMDLVVWGGPCMGFASDL